MNKKIYRAALYVRLSKEDGDKVESDSITNQKDLIRNFIESKDDIILSSERVDDGWSGVNFDRPSFMLMLEDIKARKIDCVVVKDLSRLGRNFIDTGKYIDNIFPFMGVRFISINDGIDSLNPRTSMDNIAVPVKNLMNDAYLGDISVKIRSQIETKRKKGDFVAPFATFGYLRDPNNKNKLIVDETAVATVEQIFKMSLEGVSPTNIAERLNSQNILSPMEHKRYLGVKFSTSFKTSATAKWTATAILRILKNPVYVGTLVQGKKSSPNYKVKKRFDVPEDKWVKIPNNHEAIIEQFIFDSVNDLLKSDTRTAPGSGVVYPLSGLLYCSDCNESMIRKNNGTKAKPYFYYICSSSKTKKICTSHSIRTEHLDDAVFLALREQIKNVLNMEKTLQYIATIPYTDRKVKIKTARLNEKQAEYKKYENFKMKAYDDFKSNLISRIEYDGHIKRYNAKCEEAFDDITRIEKEIEELINGNTEGQKWIEYFKEFHDVPELSRKLAVSLISKITVFENQQIHIDFKWQNEYETLLAFLDANNHIVAPKQEVI